jgi:hypothetical protein
MELLGADVVQTEVRDADARLVAQTTQTQAVIAGA